MKEPKFVIVTIRGQRGHDRIEFEAAMDFKSASRVLIAAMQQPRRKPYQKQKKQEVISTDSSTVRL